MLMLIGGVSEQKTGTSKRGNPWTGHFLSACWQDLTQHGFAMDSVFLDVGVFNARLHDYVTGRGKFPLLANVDTAPGGGQIVNITLLDTTPEDIQTFFGLN